MAPLRAALVAGALSLAVSSVAGTPEPLDDVESLVQAAAEASFGVGRGRGRFRVLKDLAYRLQQLRQAHGLPQLLGQLPKLPSSLQPSKARTEASLLPAFNCTQYPWMCKAPFNCHRPFTLAEAFRLSHQMASPTGGVNFNLWCVAPQYIETLVHSCLVEKDPAKSGKQVYEAARTGEYGPMTWELDGSYCFIEGHCSNTAVTPNTTIEEAEAMCDARYGPDGWRKNFGFLEFAVTEAKYMTNGVSMNGFKNTHLTKIFLKAACAMGNYHCDVVYCRENYCRNEYFVRKYGHLLPKVPGHKIQQLDWVP